MLKFRFYVLIEKAFRHILMGHEPLPGWTYLINSLSMTDVGHAKYNA
ncbi:MAG: hypothetical protein Q8P68_00265 [Candidatus Peregrinibacteria bacterium]|nr:hypothetical protein [Candidatus Peregrinibacteria bacterium]MDZ4245221.1 hypothetical protein [Candidatus Gracilibacteria bacterium]